MTLIAVFFSPRTYVSPSPVLMHDAPPSFHVPPDAAPFSLPQRPSPHCAPTHVVYGESGR